eukprot:3299743-Heterocapsa_arctica.AAC.1
MAVAPGSQAGCSGLDRRDSPGAAPMPTSAPLEGAVPNHCRTVTRQSEPHRSRVNDGFTRPWFDPAPRGMGT